MSDFFSVKMRAAHDGSHVSGAERIVPARRVGRTLSDLADRALAHSRARPDFINLKAEALAAEPLRIPALPVSTVTVATPDAGWAVVEETLRAAGFARTRDIRALFRETYALRGAMLLDADTLERLEPNPERGIRATNMDSVPSPAAAVKNHFAEALTLASKVLAAPGIVGEICMSDDPDYVTGYVATHPFGYRRITVLKERGDPSGGRIFLFRGDRATLAETLRFLEHTPVIVEHPAAAESPDSGAGQTVFGPLTAELAATDAAGLRRTIRVPKANLVSFASNDYLSLAGDPRVKEAAARAARDYGAGTSASRLVTGTQPPHLALERHLAAFKGTEDALVFATGYMANVGTITALVGRGDVILSDALNHASIIDGCRLSGAEVVVYPHLDGTALDDRLSRCRAYRRRLVVSDAVFSMDGDLLDLPRFLETCRRHNAFAMIDEAHSLGVVGATGHGLLEAFGLEGQANDLVLMGTLSKALGSQGGYVAGCRTLIDYLRQKSRPFIFSTAPNAAAMAAADAALSILEAEPPRVARLRENVRTFREAVGRSASDAPFGQSAIVPIVIGDEREAVRVSAELEAAGFLIPAIRYPTVAKGAARLRVALNAAHEAAALHAAARLLRTIAPR